MSWRDRIAKVLTGAMQDIRPAREDLWDVARSNFTHGTVGRNAIVPIEALQGGMSAAATDADRVRLLAEQMRNPGGYVERLIADDAGNVVEGQHRFGALRELGALDVPISRVVDLARPYDQDAIYAAIRGAGVKHPDQVHQLAGRAFETARQYGSPMAALAETTLPPPYMDAYEAALRTMGGVR